jgi:hypothetical protein
MIMGAAAGEQGAIGRPRVVVSLATIPSRIGELAPVIDSLKAQERVPDGINVCISPFCEWEGSAYDVPRWLLDDPAVRVCVAAKDYGPANKLLGVLPIETDPTTRIVIVDDDWQCRPTLIADRAVPGHWEGDLLAGGGNTHIATLVERTSRFAILVKVASKEPSSVVPALIRQIRRLPAHVTRSLTWDRGTELAHHQRFTVATGVQVYFCDPYSPWQRGTNENTNGLLRQYFPTGASLANVTQRQLDAVADQLNGRPRKTLHFRTPAEVFDEAVALIA